jgi:hypothetical protein
MIMMHLIYTYYITEVFSDVYYTDIIECPFLILEDELSHCLVLLIHN